MVDLSLVISAVMNGLVWGLALALISMGLSLIFGLMGILNFAHGGYYALGAFIAFQVIASGGNYWIALILVAFLCGILGLIVEPTLLRRLYADPIPGLLLNFGLLLIMLESIRMIWGKYGQPFFPPPELDFRVNLFLFEYPAYRLFITVLSLAIAGGIFLFLKKTKSGTLIRAGIQDREMVQVLGFNIGRTFTLTYALGTAIAGIAGLATAPLLGVYPEMGFEVLILGFVVVVVGGLGSLRGALVAGILIGQAMTLPVLFEPRLSQVMIYVVMAAVLVGMPAGLFGEK
ncbi:MAG: branched-chain amino acid ABC transporter permease [Candidatus Bathyarchaeota archaeon]|nr:branched-chain amino acid ABC transporter permease [Candidatus Bathyarchaeota archaeon]